MQTYVNPMVTVICSGDVSKNVATIKNQSYRPIQIVLINADITKYITNANRMNVGCWVCEAAKIDNIDYLFCDAVPSESLNQCRNDLMSGLAATTSYYLVCEGFALKPNAVEEMVKTIQQHPNHVGVVYADYEANTTGLITRQEGFSRFRLPKSTGPYLVNKGIITTEYDEKWAQPLEYWAHVTSKGMMVHIPKCLSVQL